MAKNKKQKKCGAAVRVERYGGGTRYACTSCDVRREGQFKMISWINATPPEDRTCQKQISA